jgi:hypothetical protein
MALREGSGSIAEGGRDTWESVRREQEEEGSDQKSRESANRHNEDGSRLAFAVVGPSALETRAPEGDEEEPCSEEDERGAGDPQHTPE